ncbi:hypothetical protein P8629_10655 [Hydrogenovibrio sp. 3SP14C1]|uniref:hypothetical protein n=1 Tax=Hydrogenovibrio sp. 3SP14C1 TaxID=3038774 RepID=UPI0024180C3E|nr:hypothetical protein [Hydrogenovibrio sp. 3SP14C1]MDG4813467.1 hypothetical protein [Hydrogenovibrio sp. 3SP14C1]
MKKIIFYLLLFLFLITYGYIFLGKEALPSWLMPYKLLLYCGLTGGIGGVLYCLRAVYLNRCVKNQWSEHWEVWYYIRPIVSVMAGFISYIFLKAGLIVLEATEVSNPSNYGFLALSFVAGLNVDNFIKKLEAIAEAAFGIKKSNVSKDEK